MDFGLKSRTALVLGAGGGLGGAIALSLAQEGAVVAIADVNGEALSVTASKIRAAGGRSIDVVWNLADLDQIEPSIAWIERELGTVDVLINNTGGPPPTPVSGQSPEKWVEHFNAMVLSVIALTDRILPAMKAKTWGRVITSTSSGVVAPIPNLGLSNALRSTLVGWSKTLAREVAPFGITSNIVLPGRIATDRIQFLDEAKAKRENRPVDAVIKESTSSIPIGRYGKPQEYGDTVAFLASERASYITGSIIRIDGGLISSI
jgi:3-oxoacyl-[acyl-carrier protein] reductase